MFPRGMPLGNGLQRTEAFSAIAHKKLTPADNQVSEVGNTFILQLIFEISTDSPQHMMVYLQFFILQ